MAAKIEYASIDNFILDPNNPRLGRAAQKGEGNPENILQQMQEWSLDELAISFLESGFWPHEALLCVREKHDGKYGLVVVEGNRRLAALLNLKAAFDGKPPSKKWKNLIDDEVQPEDLFDNIPYIVMDGRQKVDALLGFRHVTGIKEWAPAEKAQFIAYLINERMLTYKQVMRKIGSKIDAVRRNYISYSLLLQMEDIEGIDVEAVENKFSVLYLSLRTVGVQQFLGVDIKAEPGDARIPVSDNYIENLREYTRWLFGNEEVEPVVKDSRLVEKFSQILMSKPALKYFRHVEKPNFDRAYNLTDGEKFGIIDLLDTAAFSIEDALTTIHLYKDNLKVRQAAERVIKDATQLTKIFEET